ncbi:hypothetical protein [Pedobacter sp. MR2016-24]|uniref:hypothetical protein n=1 Tax=Pedobacter sp. MR2016-24 TaxID=2994466 RepID=UPI0022451753|nr:hypothetical protein [Pedobacter sp. MR2016-24]MCX2486610.1 hypothetical protein [Pedobacter sp. MR2016-24]
MLNLKQLYLILEDFLLLHPEINSVTRLAVKDYIGNRQKIYTNANIHFVSSSNGAKYITHTFLVSISDRLTPTSDNETEIMSNVLQISEDLFTFLADSYDYTFNKNVNIQSFTESDGDRTAGIFFQLNIQVLRSQNKCILPTETLFPFPQTFPIDFI